MTINKHGDLQPSIVGGDRSNWLSLGGKGLQTFSEDPATPPVVTDPIVPPVVADPIVPPVVVDPPATPKTFTQDDVSSIAAKEAKKEREKIMKQLGIEDFDNAKDGMVKFKEWQESQKTEAQKQTDELERLKLATSTSESEKKELQAQVSALKLGVKADSIQDVVVLANSLLSDTVDINAAMGLVIAKYPQFKDVVVADPEDPKKPSFTSGNHATTPPTEAAKWLEAFK